MSEQPRITAAERNRQLGMSETLPLSSACSRTPKAFFGAIAFCSLFGCGDDSDRSKPSMSGSGGAVSSNLGGAANSGTGGTGGGTSAAAGVTSAGFGGAANSSGGSNAGGATTTMVPGGVRWVGRVVPIDENTAQFAWQGAGVVASVKGSSIAVKLRTEGTSTVFFQPVVDGVPGSRFKVDAGSDQTVTLGSNLADADHVVELYRETEGAYGLSTFLGFANGTVVGAPASSARLIEVVGDSISAGYGNLGSELHPNWVASPACHWTAENSSWFSTYAAIAGRALNAEVSTVARSGWGMYRDYGGATTGVLSSIYDRALGVGDPTAWTFMPKPAVVVVNLGTNDWAKGDPGTAYETAYVAFIATLRSKYPNAWIFLTIGSMTGEPALTQVKTRLANVVAAVTAATSDQRLFAFDLGTQNLGPDGSVPSGCDWHPNVADHQRMAGVLQKHISAKLGW